MSSMHTHFGDPCLHCGIPHDAVPIGPCTGDKTLHIFQLEDRCRLLASQVAECQQHLAVAEEQLAQSAQLMCQGALSLKHMMDERDALRLRVAPARKGGRGLKPCSATMVA